MATGKAKSIDEIGNIKEMHQMMKALEISSKGVKTIEQMKNLVKSEIEQSPNITSWTVGQVSVLFIESFFSHFLEHCLSS